MPLAWKFRDVWVLSNRRKRRRGAADCVLVSLRHLPWARVRFRRARVIRDSRTLQNDEEHEERRGVEQTIRQNGACRDHGHLFISFLSRSRSASLVSYFNLRACERESRSISLSLSVFFFFLTHRYSRSYRTYVAHARIALSLEGVFERTTENERETSEERKTIATIAICTRRKFPTVLFYERYTRVCVPL